MRVLLVSPNFYPKVGGIESHLFEVIHHLQDVEFVVLTDWRSDVKRQTAAFPGVEFAYVWPADRELRKWLARFNATMRPYRAFMSLIEFLRTLNRAGWLRRLDVELVHVHYLGLDQTDRIAKKVGVERLTPRLYHWVSSRAKEQAPVLFTDHTVFTAPDEIVPEMTKQALLAAFDNIISVDRASHEVIRSHQSVHGGRAWFIPNSVDSDQFRGVRRQHDDFRVGYAARLGKLGQNLLEKVARHLAGDVKWHIAVAGEAIDVLRTGLRDLAPGATFYSNLDYTRMPEYYASIDVLLNPFPGEGVGRTTLEAMSCGVPVIGVGTGDKYPIRNAETGFLAPPDPEAISATIQKLRNDPDLTRSMGANARAMILSEFSNALLMPKLKAVYSELAEENGKLGARDVDARFASSIA